MRPEITAITCRIICIGNSLLREDSAGSKVYASLRAMELPPHVAVVDGGLAGLNLLSLLERMKRVIFVDRVNGFRSIPGIVKLRLPNDEIRPGPYGHDAGIGYLMEMAPLVLGPVLPECILVGIEGMPPPGIYHRAAKLCVRLAAEISAKPDRYPLFNC